RRCRRIARPHRGPLLRGTGGVSAAAELVRAILRTQARRRARVAPRNPSALRSDIDRARHDGSGSPDSGGPSDSAAEGPVKRWEALVNHLGWGIVAASGLLYGVLKYFVHGSDPDSRLAVPWQPSVLAAHVLA